MTSKIGIKENRHNNPLTPEFPGTNTNSTTEFFSISNFKSITSINIKKSNEEKLVFDLKGIDSSLANALRRILISEIPTMAIENCIFYQNTSVIPDEVLAHRLGLIPIQADANLFNFKVDSEEYSEFNYLTFKLHVACEKEPVSVYSNQLKWIPQGNQLSRMTNVKPVHPDILIAKLNPGQEIEAELVIVKGIGKTHAKWSPVCTAFYRLLPEVTIKSTFKGEKAKKLKELCPMGVFDIEDSGKAVVKDSEKCSMCRECIRIDEFKDDIELSKLRNQYECKCVKLLIIHIFTFIIIFHLLQIVTIESVGIYSPSQLFVKALEVLKNKCVSWKEIVQDKISKKE